METLKVVRAGRYRCAVCGLRILIEYRYPDPRAASVDHRIPLAHGGKHEKANLQVVHLACNLRTRARPDAVVRREIREKWNEHVSLIERE
jgi:5-methylcytosine-specific restriction endonuclease McrA